ncbi:MAG: hypothetical protein FWE90_09105, partial [Defluviitaleaceae bacterium]|nr:hypothetical protein [Defluviitaleaceae bacterium]
LLCLAYNFKRVTNILEFKDIMARLDERLRFMTLSFDFLFSLLFNPLAYSLPTTAQFPLSRRLLGIWPIFHLPFTKCGF